MVIVFGSGESVDRNWLLSQLKGEYARQCLDKIEIMNGQIVAIDFDLQNPQGSLENIYFEIGEVANRGFAQLRTDDSCVSWGSMGSRWETRDDLVAEVTRQDSFRRSIRQEEVEKDRAASTNLVTV